MGLFPQLPPNPYPGPHRTHHIHTTGQSAGQTRYRVLLHVIRTLYSAVNTWRILGLPLLGLGDSRTNGGSLQGEQPPALLNIVTYLCNKFCVYYSDLFPGAFYGIP